MVETAASTMLLFTNVVAAAHADRGSNSWQFLTAPKRAPAELGRSKRIKSRNVKLLPPSANHERHAHNITETLSALEQRWSEVGWAGGLIAHSFECFRIGFPKFPIDNRALFAQRWWLTQSGNGSMSAAAEKEIMKCIRRSLDEKRHAVAREQRVHAQRVSMFPACFLRQGLPMRLFDNNVPITVGLAMPTASHADRGPAFPHDAWNPIPLEHRPSGGYVRPPCRDDLLLDASQFTRAVEQRYSSLAEQYAVDRIRMLNALCQQCGCCDSLANMTETKKELIAGSIARAKTFGCWHNGSHWEAAFMKQHMATMSTLPVQRKPTCCNQLVLTNQVGVYSQHLRNAMALYYVNNTPSDSMTQLFGAKGRRLSTFLSRTKAKHAKRHRLTDSETNSTMQDIPDTDFYSYWQQRCRPPGPIPGSPDFRLAAAAAARAYIFAVLIRDLIANEKLLAGADASSAQWLPIVQFRQDEGFLAPSS